VKKGKKKRTGLFAQEKENFFVFKLSPPPSPATNSQCFFAILLSAWAVIGMTTT
jgi:hypothetical protein